MKTATAVSTSPASPAPKSTVASPAAFASRLGLLLMVGLVVGIMATTGSASAALAQGGTVPATPHVPVITQATSAAQLATASLSAHAAPVSKGPNPHQLGTYGGGPVMHHPTVYVIWWAPAGTGYDGAADPNAIAASSANFETEIDDWFLNINNSVWMGNLQQYGDSLGSPGMNVKLGGVFQDSNPYPNGEGSFGNPLLGADIQNEIAFEMALHDTPGGLNVSYEVMLPLGVYVDETFADGISGESDYDWCAGSADFTLGSETVVYDVLPDPGTTIWNCAPSLAFTAPYSLMTTYPFGPSGSNFVDAQLNLLSLAFGDTVIDPIPLSGWSYDGFFDLGYACAWRYFGSTPFQDNANFALNGTPYFIQPMYNDSAGGCLAGPLNGAPVPTIGPVTSGAQVEVGQPDWVDVTDNNNGADAAGMNLSIALPPGTILSSISVVTNGFPSTPVIVPPLMVVSGCYDLCKVAPGVPVVMVNATNWVGGTGYDINITFEVGQAESTNISVDSAAVPDGLGDFADWGPATGPLDALGQYAWTQPLLVVHGPLVGVPFSSTVSGDVGQPVWFNSTLWSPGGGGVTYHWTQSAPGLGCGASVSLSEYCVPTAAGTYRTTIYATDVNLGSSWNTSAAFTVFPDPSALAPVASRTSVDVGQSVTFTGNVAGPGSGGDTYSWTSSPSGLGCPASGSATVTCTAAAAGTYTVSFWVRDSNGVKGVGTASFTVYADPTIQVDMPASQASADVSQVVTFTSTITSPGSGTPTYQWTPSSLGFGCGVDTLATYTCVPSAAGTYTVSVETWDSNGGNGSGQSLSFTIYALPAVNAPAPGAGQNPEVGQPITYWATVITPGSGGDVFAWSATSILGCPAAVTGDNITCTPSSAGAYTITVTVTDSNHGTGSASSSSLQPVAASLTLTATASVQSGNAPLTVAFQTVVTGGVAPYTYVWHFGDGADDASPLPSPSWTYTSAGTFTASVFVNDSAGHSAKASVEVTVGAQVVQSNPLGFLPGGAFDLLLILLVVILLVVMIYITNRHHKASLEHDHAAAQQAAWSAGAAPAPGAAAYPTDAAGAPPTDAGMGGAPPAPPPA